MTLKITARAGNPLDVQDEPVVVAVFSLVPTKTGALPEPLRSIDKTLDGRLAKLIAKEEFTGKREQSLAMQSPTATMSGKLTIVGLGDAKQLKVGDLRAVTARIARAAQNEKATSLTLVLPDDLRDRLRTIGEGLELGAYRFTRYLTGDRKPKSSLEKVTLVFTGKFTAASKEELELGQRIGTAINTTRDLGNEPPNEITPRALTQAAQTVAKANGLKAELFDYKEIVKRGMKLVQAVGQGSENKPSFAHLTYTPGKKAKKTVVFVGKGITFDSGGLSIKPAPGMGDMKSDMSGAGNLVGLMAAVAALKPNVEVHAILVCAENMPDGGAYRPGDIWGSLDGKTVEIVNTDAEGRLLLADALAYARELKPDLLVDNATLTGACVVALGTTCSAFYATNDESAKLFAGAVRDSGEQMWRMPLLEDLKEGIKSDVADVKQAGDRWGGSITAALFLREFIGDTKNWVHVDIAGPAFLEKPNGWSPRGASGHGILTFLSLIESMEN